MTRKQIESLACNSEEDIIVGSLWARRVYNHKQQRYRAHWLDSRSYKEPSAKEIKLACKET